MNWIKTAVIMGAVTLVLLVAGVRKLDREEEGKRRSGSKDKEPPASDVGSDVGVGPHEGIELSKTKIKIGS